MTQLPNNDWRQLIMDGNILRMAAEIASRREMSALAVALRANGDALYAEAQNGWHQAIAEARNGNSWGSTDE